MTNDRMPAARLHGPRDLRVDEVPCPGEPPEDHVLLRVEAVGICGSDLHTYRCAELGTTQLKSPVILGHEFAGVVAAVGPACRDAGGHALQPGVRVAVDPAQPCGRCEFCLRGDPNLCPHIKFCGLWPDDGALRPLMHVPADTCFPVPKHMDAVTATMLEPFGVAIHTMDLAKLCPAESVVVIGLGCIGLCILQLAVRRCMPGFCGRQPALAGGASGPVWGDGLLHVGHGHRASCDGCHLRPWCGCGDRSGVWRRGAFQAAEILAPGGRLMAVGIDEDDRLLLRHSTARRKGLTIRMVRRMKNAYGRAIRLAEQGQIDLAGLVTHRFPLDQAPEAFALNADYRDGVVKTMIEIDGT